MGSPKFSFATTSRADCFWMQLSACVRVRVLAYVAALGTQQLDDELQLVHGALALQKGVAAEQFREDAAERPDVHLPAVGLRRSGCTCLRCSRRGAPARGTSA